MQITHQNSGERLDKFLCSMLPVNSRSKIQQSIHNGSVYIDGKVILDPAYKLKEGQIIELHEDFCKQEIMNLTPENIEFTIIFEDEHLLVLDKPAGLVVHPGSGNWRGTLVNGLLGYTTLSNKGEAFRPGIVHRIDKDTSGILVIAKNDIVHDNLAKQFAEHTIDRKYTCFVYGSPNLSHPLVSAQENKWYLIETNIGRHDSHRQKMCVKQTGGKKAITLFRTVNSYHGVSKIECQLKTGRTHQVRVHMSFLNSPIIGDQIYGKKKDLTNISEEENKYIKDFPRQALHAITLSFSHPHTQERMIFTSEIPNDMKKIENIFSK